MGELYLNFWGRGAIVQRLGCFETDELSSLDDDLLMFVGRKIVLLRVQLPL